MMFDFEWTAYVYLFFLLVNVSVLFYILNEDMVRGWWKKISPQSKDSPKRGRAIVLTIGKRPKKLKAS